VEKLIMKNEKCDNWIERGGEGGEGAVTGGVVSYI